MLKIYREYHFQARNFFRIIERDKCLEELGTCTHTCARISFDIKINT